MFRNIALLGGRASIHEAFLGIVIGRGISRLSG